MKIKKLVKGIIGNDVARKLNSELSFIKDCVKNTYRIKIAPPAKLETVVSFSHSHVFCGYFDLSPDNPFNKNEVLVHVLKKHAIPGINSISICVVNIETGSKREITTSNAWSWQMGARARWSSKHNRIYVNDCIHGKYVCRIINTTDGSLIDEIPAALYDISPDEKWGVSINFSRLQRLRPGYGYSNLEDITQNETIPKNDGLYLVNLEEKTKTLLLSYSQLDELLPKFKKGECYLNHISFSPKSDKIMFFYIWTVKTLPGWKATLWIYDLKTGKTRCLEDEKQVSHYTWKNDYELLITEMDLDSRQCCYCLYNVDTGEKLIYDYEKLCSDGHPSFSRSNKISFYSDTYPDTTNHQAFFVINNGEYIELASLYHDPRMYEERRCDLHPHYFQTAEKVAIDTTYRNNKRSVAIISLE